MSPETPSAVPADRAGFLLSRVGTAVQSGFKGVLAHWEVRPLHFLVLRAIGTCASSSQQELCRALAIDSGNMVELLDTLEALGYARRAADPHDRRRHMVSITATGRKALSQIGKAVDEFDGQFLAPLDADERRLLVGLLEKIYAPTAEARGGGYTVVAGANPRDATGPPPGLRD